VHVSKIAISRVLIRISVKGNSICRLIKLDISANSRIGLPRRALELDLLSNVQRLWVTHQHVLPSLPGA
jgi:hypothetical protein